MPDSAGAIERRENFALLMPVRSQYGSNGRMSRMRVAAGCRSQGLCGVNVLRDVVRIATGDVVAFQEDGGIQESAKFGVQRDAVFEEKVQMMDSF